MSDMMRRWVNRFFNIGMITNFWGMIFSILMMLFYIARGPDFTDQLSDYFWWFIRFSVYFICLGFFLKVLEFLERITVALEK